MYLVLLILTIIYIPIYIWVRRSPRAKKLGLVEYGPTVMIKTKSGTKIMDKWSKYRRFWRFFGLFSIATSLCLMAFIVFIIVVGITNLPNSLASKGIGVEYALAIPGLNPLIPILYGWIGLVVAMIIHELAHGFQTRANDMRVDSTGVLYGVVPLGAFVEPNEEDIKKSSRRAKLDLYSAGVSMNVITAAVTFFIFAVLMLGGVSSAYGDSAAVYQITPDSPALAAGIPDGAIILSVNGEEYFYVSGEEYFDDTPTYSWEPGMVVSVEYRTQDGIATKNMIWGLFIERVSPNSPADGILKEKNFIISINGTLIYGQREFLSYMKETTPGTIAEITCMSADGGEPFTKTITLGNNGGKGYVGIVTSTSGMYFITPNIMLENGRNPIYGAESVSGVATSALAYIAGPFNGFSPVPQDVHWWYDVPMEGIFWILRSVLYWIFWLNIMLGVTNAIPAYPFDGGFIFQGSLSSLLQRLGMKNDKKREEITSKITGSLSMIMIFMLILTIAAVVL
jgi:membrane-associated protease RseP (regulator of RpoE activity)